MQKKKLKRDLFKSSFKLYLLYLISTIMLITVYSNSGWEILIGKVITISVLNFIIFIFNLENIAFFIKPKQKEQTFHNTQRNIFITGFLFTMLLFFLHYRLSIYLASLGVVVPLPENLINAGWGRVTIILFSISLVEYTFIYLIQNFTLSQHEKSRFEMELLQLKASNAETLNQLLQQQIKPHFLFNALTTLKSLIKKKPKEAETYLIQLSTFLRASFANSESNSGLNTIKEELNICFNYMEMQKIRFGKALCYEVTDNLLQTDTRQHIPTFSLQPLLENAIKHNIITQKLPLTLKIFREDDYITVSNNSQPKSSLRKDSTGRGLSSLKERYKILSGDEVKVVNTEDVFSVSIKILQP